MDHTFPIRCHLFPFVFLLLLDYSFFFLIFDLSVGEPSKNTSPSCFSDFNIFVVCVGDLSPVVRPTLKNFLNKLALERARHYLKSKQAWRRKYNQKSWWEFMRRRLINQLRMNPPGWEPTKHSAIPEKSSLFSSHSDREGRIVVIKGTNLRFLNAVHMIFLYNLNI